MNSFQRVAATVNKLVMPLLKAPVAGSALSRSMAVVSYTGRKSGKTFRLPVNYLAKGDDTLTIGVALPDRKTWWRNFYPDAAPITVEISGRSRTGTAIAQRDPDRGVRVKVAFDA